MKHEKNNRKTTFSYSSLRLNSVSITGVSLKWAFCHEMGHNVNLGESEEKSAIMFPRERGQDVSQLSADDLLGITSLYGGPNGKVRPLEKLCNG